MIRHVVAGYIFVLEQKNRKQDDSNKDIKIGDEDIYDSQNNL